MRRFAVTLLLLAFVACTPHEKDDLANERPNRTQATPGTAPATGTNVAPPQERNPNNQIAGSAEGSDGVQLLEYEIRMPQTLTPGSRTFTISNGGKEEHAFEIKGNGVNAGVTALSRGDSTKLTVDLPAGTYEVYCPVDGHKAKGMTTTINVR